MQCGEYTKLKYCDLLSDLEPLVAVDSTLLGLSDIDFEYDEQMRYWVGRQHETPKAPDPSKPLIDVNNISISTPDTPAEPDDHGRASTSVQP